LRELAFYAVTVVDETTWEPTTYQGISICARSLRVVRTTSPLSPARVSPTV